MSVSTPWNGLFPPVLSPGVLLTLISHQSGYGLSKAESCMAAPWELFSTRDTSLPLFPSPLRPFCLQLPPRGKQILTNPD